MKLEEIIKSGAIGLFTKKTKKSFTISCKLKSKQTFDSYYCIYANCIKEHSLLNGIYASVCLNQIKMMTLINCKKIILYFDLNHEFELENILEITIIQLIRPILNFNLSEKEIFRDLEIVHYIMANLENFK